NAMGTTRANSGVGKQKALWRERSLHGRRGGCGACSPHRAADGSDLVRTHHPGDLPHDGHCDSVVEGHFAPPLIWQTTDAESVSWAAPSTPSTTATSSRPARSKRPSTSTRWFSSPPDGRTRRTSTRSRVQSIGI